MALYHLVTYENFPPKKAVQVHVAIDLEKEGEFQLQKEERFGQLYF